MIESPYLEEFLTERDQEARQDTILHSLRGRFDTVPDQLAREVRTVVEIDRLKEVAILTGKCKSLKEFHKRLKEIKARP